MMKITELDNIELTQTEDSNYLVAVHFDRDNRCIQVLRCRVDEDDCVHEPEITTMGKPQWADMTQEQWDDIVDAEELEFNQAKENLIQAHSGMSH